MREKEGRREEDGGKTERERKVGRWQAVDDDGKWERTKFAVKGKVKIVYVYVCGMCVVCVCVCVCMCVYVYVCLCMYVYVCVCVCVRVSVCELVCAVLCMGARLLYFASSRGHVFLTSIPAGLGPLVHSSKRIIAAIDILRGIGRDLRSEVHNARDFKLTYGHTRFTCDDMRQMRHEWRPRM